MDYKCKRGLTRTILKVSIPISNNNRSIFVCDACNIVAQPLRGLPFLDICVKTK